MTTQKPPARTFKKRYGVMICSACNLSTTYCKCPPIGAPDVPSGDAAAASSLQQRINECKGE